MFSATDISGNSARSCQITWMPRARAVAGLSPTIERPSNSMAAPGSGWCTPLMILIRVLLPQPFSPARHRTSPRRISKRTSSRAFTPPNCLEMCSSCSSGPPAMLDRAGAVMAVRVARLVWRRNVSGRPAGHVELQRGRGLAPRLEAHLGEVVHRVLVQVDQLVDDQVMAVRMHHAETRDRGAILDGLALGHH